MFIHLVRDYETVMFAGQLRDNEELVSAKHFARRVGRIADHNRLGTMLLERFFQFFPVEMKFWRMEGDMDWNCSRQDRVRSVVLVKRRENDDPLARITSRHHRDHHGLGAAAGDHQMLVRIDV
jgi:hypothetical protein